MLNINKTTQNSKSTNSSNNNNNTEHKKLALIPQAKIRTTTGVSSSSSSNSKAFNQQVASEKLEMEKTRASSVKQLGKSQTRRENNTNSNIKHKSQASSQPQNQELEIWSSLEELFWDHMKEVQNKWSTLKLNDDIWAKLIYFEQNRRVAKAYVSAPVLTIDGSTSGLDGFRIGLSGIDNIYRNLNSVKCLRSIGLGMKLKIDSQGNILIRKIGAQPSQTAATGGSSMRKCSIWVRDWPSPSAGTSGNNKPSASAKNAALEGGCMMREIEKSDISYKLFDMRKFRLQLEKRRLNNDNSPLDWRQCVTIINFSHQSIEIDKNQSTLTNYKNQTNNKDDHILENPCWLMLINIIAIDMLKTSFCDKIINDHCSSTLIQQHSLLESNNNRANHHEQRRQQHLSSSSMNNNPIDGPLRASSSASILTPSSSNRLAYHHKQQQQPNGNVTYYNSSTSSSNRVSNSSGTDSNQNLLLASNERIKKLRTSNNRYRPSSMFRDNPISGSGIDVAQRNGGLRYPIGNNQRRYQSTQQLPTSTYPNNTIYTTFNSKFLNSFTKSHADTSSTSDYNSGSRHNKSSGARSNWLNYHSYQQKQNNNQPDLHYQASSSLYPLDSSLIREHRQDRRLKGSDRGVHSALNYNDEFEYGMNENEKVRMFTTMLPPIANTYHRSTSSSSSSANRLEPKSISLSAFDLSRGRLDMRCSIKMNYDNESDMDFIKRPQRLINDDEDDFYRLDEEERSLITANSEQKLPFIHNQRPYSAISSGGSPSGDNANGTGNNKKLSLSKDGEITNASQGLFDFKSNCANGGEKLVKQNGSTNGMAACFCNSNDGKMPPTSSPTPITTNMTNKSSSSKHKLSLVNHHECEAMRGVKSIISKADNEENETTIKERQQKLSRSSIDSSSSSSGCVDNDYFMSHSSSSMSSSTASNDRELFSQPESSSGIMCSGSTSDEYEVEGNLGKQQTDVQANHSTIATETTNKSDSKNTARQIELVNCKNSDNKCQQQQHPSRNSSNGIRLHRRGYRIKTIEPPPDYICVSSDEACAQDEPPPPPTGQGGEHFEDCDCPYNDGTEKEECDCECNCFSTEQKNFDLKKDEATSKLNAHAEDDYSIYSRLPHPMKLTTAEGDKVNGKCKETTGNINKANKLTGGSGNKISSPLAGSENQNELDYKLEKENSGEVAKLTNPPCESTKDFKQSSSWRYSKILPKFIFSSSSTNRHQMSSQRSEIKNGKMQRKSNTLDRDGKFRLIKSTQDLS